MVNQSELAFRMLCRRRSPQPILAYTPMLHARLFSEGASYREQHFFSQLTEGDRPLIVQFCGDDVRAAAMARLNVTR